MARDAVSRFLDSTGYFNAVWDTTAPSLQKVFPGKRCTVIGEHIEVTRSFLRDSIVFPPSDFYPMPFDASKINHRVREIGDVFMRYGYPFVKVVTDIKTAGTPDMVNVWMYVETDSLYRFTTPRLVGTYTTARQVLIHDIAIVKNAVFSVSAIDQSIERLNSRNYVLHATTEPPVIVDVTDTTMDSVQHVEATGKILVPFIITDRSGMGLDGAIGFEAREDESPLLYGNLEFTFLNLFHVGEEAELSYTGDRDRQRMDGRFSRPWLFGLPLKGTLGGGLEIEQDNYGYIYGNLGLLYEAGVRWHAGIEFNGNNVTEGGSDTPASGSFSGLDIIVMRDAEPLQDGEFSRQVLIATGSGFSRKQQRYSRSHLDFSVSLQLPFPHHQAVRLHGFSGHIISNEQHLVASEIYRVGGTRSIRGYAENEYAFRTILYGQAEYLYYFQRAASLYFLCDGGIGFGRGIDVDRSYVKMFGYGIGIRLPVAFGTFSVEWARNITDRRSPGRIHIRLQNPISAVLNGGISSIRNK